LLGTLLKRKENLAVGLLFEIEMAPVAANMGYSRGRVYLEKKFGEKICTLYKQSEKKAINSMRNYGRLPFLKEKKRKKKRRKCRIPKRQTIINNAKYKQFITRYKHFAASLGFLIIYIH
jgi:hypothetical protein